MDQQKFCAAAMTLAKALVDLDRANRDNQAALPAPLIQAYENTTRQLDELHIMPEIPLHIAQQIMTRADFAQSYDHLNLFTIDALSMVRADSVPMMNAFRDICNTEGFAKHLEAAMDRVAAIESLDRTRELVAKDLGNGSKLYEVIKTNKGFIMAIRGKEP